MKKKFIIHLDAVLALIVLFIGVIALIIFLQSQISKLSQDKMDLQWKLLENSFNLDAKQDRIHKLEKKLDGK